MRLFKIILIINILLFHLFTSSKEVLAYFFEEEFNNNYTDQSKWEVNQNEGNLSFETEPGFLSLSSSMKSFPFIKTLEDIIPDGNFEIEIKFKYLPILSDFGNGIVVSGKSPTNGGNLTSEHGIIAIWQDNISYLRIETPLCSENNSSCTTTSVPYKTSAMDFNDHVVRIVYENSKYKIFVDSDLIFTSIITPNIPNNIWLGNPRILSANHDWASFAVEYIRISELPDQLLDVPLYSQNDSLWANHEYDHASQWASTYDANPYMERWACAISSFAMVANYYGVNLLPNNKYLNPDNLNDYLTENNLYVNGGEVDWTKLLKILRDKDNKFDYVYKNASLDYEDYQMDSLKNNLDNNIPEILWVSEFGDYWDGFGGHFVVAKGYDEDTVLLNDPEWHDPEWPNYPNSVIWEDEIPYSFPTKRRVKYFVNENLDDSAKGVMQLNTLAGVDMLVIDNQGRRLGRDRNKNIYHEIPDGNYIESTMPAGYGYSFEFQEFSINHIVSNSSYSITLASDEDVEFSIEMNTLNSDQSSVKKIIENNIKSGETKSYNIIFSDDEGNSFEEVIKEEPVTFDSVEEFIKEEYKNKNIKNLGVRNMLLAELKISEKFYEKNMVKLFEKTLNHMIKMIDSFSPWFIKKDTANELIEMIEEVKTV